MGRQGGNSSKSWKKCCRSNRCCASTRRSSVTAQLIWPSCTPCTKNKKIARTVHAATPRNSSQKARANYRRCNATTFTGVLPTQPPPAHLAFVMRSASPSLAPVSHRQQTLLLMKMQRRVGSEKTRTEPAPCPQDKEISRNSNVGILARPQLNFGLTWAGPCEPTFPC